MAAGVAKPLCVHCRRKPAGRPRGLCWACYYDPAVKALYPVVPQSVRGTIDCFRKSVLAPEPTPAEPGSPEKKRVMMERIAAGFSPFHPQDGWSDLA